MDEQRERILVIDIHVTRGLVAVLSLALMVVILMVYLGRDPGGVAASEVNTSSAASSSLRQYYLTQTTHDGANVLGACAAGYHMASLWEILEPSNLKYNTELGRTTGDSGQGPTTWPGWVRTGIEAEVGALPGQGNCYGWTENVSGANGTLAGLSWGSQDFHVWHAFTLPCDNLRSVWCVED